MTTQDDYKTASPYDNGWYTESNPLHHCLECDSHVDKQDTKKFSFTSYEKFGGKPTRQTTTVCLDCYKDLVTIRSGRFMAHAYTFVAICRNLRRLEAHTNTKQFTYSNVDLTLNK